MPKELCAAGKATHLVTSASRKHCQPGLVGTAYTYPYILVATFALCIAYKMPPAVIRHKVEYSNYSRVAQL